VPELLLHFVRVLVAALVIVALGLATTLFGTLGLAPLFQLAPAFSVFFVFSVAPAMLAGGYISAKRITPGSLWHPTVAAFALSSAHAVVSGVRPVWPGVAYAVGCAVIAATGAYLATGRQRAA
jgi:hypothetical protein